MTSPLSTVVLIGSICAALDGHDAWIVGVVASFLNELLILWVGTSSEEV